MRDGARLAAPNTYGSFWDAADRGNRLVHDMACRGHRERAVATYGGVTADLVATVPRLEAIESAMRFEGRTALMKLVELRRAHWSSRAHSSDTSGEAVRLVRAGVVADL